MKKIINLFTLGVFLISNIITPLTNFIYAAETETVEEVDDVAVVRDVVGEKTSDEAPELSPEETDNDSIGEAGTPDEEEEQSGEINYPEVQPEDQSGEGSQEGEQVDGTSSESSESHNSAVTPSDNTEGEVEEGEPVTEAENQDVQAEERILMEDEDRDIMGKCSGNQDYNEDLDICYNGTVINNIPVYYGTDMNPYHEYNDHPISTITVKIDGERTITMMDINLGATSNDINSTASYGKYYQWGNNYGFVGNEEKTSTLENDQNYRPGNRYSSNKMLYSNNVPEYWENNYTNLWGGQGDAATTTNIDTFRGGVKNGANRQGPCPDGYHVPSMGEWNALITYWYNRNNYSQTSYTTLNSFYSNDSFKTVLKLPSAGGYWTGNSLGANGAGLYWSSSFGYLNTEDYIGEYPTYYVMNLGNLSASYTVTNAANGLSLRCFKDSPEVVTHTVTFHDDSGRVLGMNNGKLKQIIKDGQKISKPTVTKPEYTELLWKKDSNQGAIFNLSDTVEEDMDLYATWNTCEPENYIADLERCYDPGKMRVIRDVNGNIIQLMDEDYEDLEVYFLQKNGTLTHYTLMDRNLGATEVYNQDSSHPNIASYGYHYQWGNNYGFAPCIGNNCDTFPKGETSSNTRVSSGVWNIGPSKFASNVFIYGYSDWRNGEVAWQTDNIWGGAGDNREENGDGSKIGENNDWSVVKNRQGPCPDDYYIPSRADWTQITSEWNNSSPAKDGNKFAADLLLAPAGYREDGSYDDPEYDEIYAKKIYSQGVAGEYRTSSRSNLNGWSNNLYFNLSNNSSYNIRVSEQSLSFGHSIRCAKSYVNDKTLNIHGDTGTYTVVAFTGDIGAGKITALGTPSKDNYIFEGWYSDANYQHEVNVGDTVPSDLYAKGKCEEGFIMKGDNCVHTGKLATLIPGEEFNKTLKTLAKGEPVTGYSSGDSLIKGFEWKDSLPIGINIGEDTVVISTENSDYPVYAWFDTDGYDNGEGIIYYTSEADIIYMNPDSRYMFEYMQGMTSLNLSDLDTSDVTNMSYMFYSCSNLTSLNLDNWNLSKISSYSYMGGMFGGTSSLKTLSLKKWILPKSAAQFISDWGPSLATELDWIDVTDWDLSKTTSLYALFANNKTKKIIGLDTWDTSNVTDMSSMFYNCTNLTELDLSNFDTSKVTTMNSMFYNCTNLTELDLSNFDTSKVTTMSCMFYSCSNLTSLNLDNWDISGLVFSSGNQSNIGSLFRGATSLKRLSLRNWILPTDTYSLLSSWNPGLEAELDWIDVSGWDLSKTTSLYALFASNKTKDIIGLDTWDTSNVTNMYQTFYYCTNLKALDLSSWDTSNVTNMTIMFNYTSQLRTIYASNKFKTNNVSNSASMFYSDTLLVGGKGTTYNSSIIDKTYAKLDGGSSNPGYFTATSRITYNLNGGERGSEGTPKNTYAAVRSFTLPIPVREGYTFVGWTGSNGNIPIKEVIIPEGTRSTLNFTANWEINNYQIIFDTDGGKEIDPIEVEYNSSLVDIELPTSTKECGKFVRWEPELPETMPAEDVTLKAVWSNTCYQYSGGGGGGKSSAIDVVKESVDNNVDTHKAADDKEGELADNVKESTDSSKAETSASTYSEEFTEAYSFAKSNGITTKSSIQEAQMDKTLTRIQMAKMLSYYAINVLGQTPDTTKTVKFRDVSAKRDAEYDNGVTLAYQLGIMGINMKNNKFRPNDEVTRAEFVTALSRMINGMRDGTGKQKYYEPHMARLYNEGIINETNPKMKEKRGYVMIMLMRTVK